MLKVPASLLLLIKRRPLLIRQTGKWDCGAAALATICSYFGTAPELQRLKRLTSINREGTSLADIVGAARELGLESSAYEVSESGLDTLRVPAITSVGYHFVVIDKVGRNKVRIGDPATGWHEISRSQFLDSWSHVAVTFAPGPGYQSLRLKRGGSVRRLWQFAVPYRSLMGIMILLSLAGNILGLALPVLTQVIVDRTRFAGAVSGQNMILVVAAALVLGGLVEGVRMMTVSRIAARLYVSMGDKFTRHLMNLPWTYFLTRTTGDSIGRMEEVQQLSSFVGSRGAEVCVNTVLIGLSLVVVFCYQKRVGAFLLGAAFVLLMTGLLLGRILSTRLLRAIHLQVEAITIFIESVRKIALLKTYGAEATWAERWEKKASEAAFLLVRGRDTGSLFAATMQVILRSTPFAVVMLGLRGSTPLSTGSLVGVTAISSVTLSSILTLSNALIEASQAKLSLRRIMEVLDEEPEPQVVKTAPAAARLSGPLISVRDLSFHYSGQASRPALNRLTFDIERGSMVAIVGPSGCGKTTLAHILSGLLVPFSGQLLFDGIPTDRISPARLRARVALVHQDCPLVEGTILSNIAIGDRNPNLRGAHQAAESALALDFILEHPLGFQRLLSEDGVGLSAGQRQRIAIARALYRDPDVIMLDEPTSALDAESERQLIESLNRLRRRRTVVIIAHRLRTIVNVDRVLVLEGGEMVEHGSPVELLQREGRFATLVDASHAAYPVLARFGS